MTGTTTSARDGGRDRALDGLRGLAASIVVLHHVVVASSATLASAYGNEVLRDHSLAESALQFSPLHLLWGGREAVVIFFVLSGFVLALPVARGRALRPLEYYPRRLARLYLPVWGALIFSAVLHVAVSHDAAPDQTWWLNIHDVPITVRAAIDNATLLTSSTFGGQFTTVLWSLRWEVIFSLMLPFVLIAMTLLRRLPRIAMVAAAGAVLLAFLVSPRAAVVALAPFLLGVLLAYERDGIEAVGRRLTGARRRIVVAALAVGAVMLLSSRWWLRTSTWELAPGPRALLVSAGACALLVLVLLSPGFRRLLEARPMHWLGTRSYSLYLIHEPIVVTVAFALGGTAVAPVLLAASLPVVLVLTEGFFRVVERPSHRLSRRLGASAQRLAPGHRPLRTAQP